MSIVLRRITSMRQSVPKAPVSIIQDSGPYHDPKLEKPHKVAFDQAFGILGNAKDPFQPGFLHPFRGPCNRSNDEFICAPDTYGHRDLQFIPVSIEPHLLFGIAKGQQQDIGPGSVDLL